MAGIENKIIYGEGFKLSPSSARSISDMQRTANDISCVNYTGNPEGNISANPSSLCHNPSTGDLYKKDSGTSNTGWVLIGSGSGFSSVNIQKFTVNGTYTPTPGMKYCVVEGVGGGGGAGGAGDTTSSPAAVAASAGGGSGGYVKATLTAAQVGASAAIVIGSGGAGGTTTSNGTDGGDTTFTNAAATLVFNAGGGLGGAGNVFNQSNVSLGGLGGSNTLGAFDGYEFNGSVGGNGFGTINGYNGNNFGCGGSGANSFFGGGGAAGAVRTGYGPSVSMAGSNALPNTGGGGGGSTGNNAAAVAGADGADGIIIITEFI